MRALIFLAASIVGLSSAAVGQTYVRLDIGPSGQRIATDFLGVGTAANGAGATNFAQTTFTSLTGDTFTLAIDNRDATGVVAGGIDWRSRGESSGTDSLVHMAEDFIKNNSGVIRLVLGSIPAGTYEITSFHRDAEFGQSDKIQVFVNGVLQEGAMGNAGPAALAGVGVNALTNDNIQSSAATFNITSDGTSDVVIVFDGRTSSDDETPLNGMVITTVPEPSTALLAGAGIALLGFGRRRRTRVA